MLCAIRFIGLYVAALLAPTCEAVFEFNHMIANGGIIKNEFQLVSLPNMGIDLENSRYSIDVVTPIEVAKRSCGKGIQSPAEITVNFSSSNQSSGDWIGLYSPAGVNITTVVPVKLGYCSDSSDYLLHGAGSLRFRLTNTRSSVAVYMFRGNLALPVAVSRFKSTISFIDENEPLSPRVSADHGSKELRLTWSSKSSKAPRLRWGPTPGLYDHDVSATTSFFNKSTLFSTPATTSGWFQFGATHSAIFHGISMYSGGRIYYQFGDDASSDYSCEYILDVPYLKRSTRPDRPTSFLAFGDMGRPGYDDALTWFHYGRPAANTVDAVASALEQQTTDAVFFLGDISYASGYLAVWNEFVDDFSTVSSRVPILPVPGNHEADAMHDPADALLYQSSVSGGEGNTASAFLLPMPTPATVSSSWWSFDIDNIHLIGIDTESNISSTSLQYAWLENDLKCVDRSRTPWVILGGHRPMYVDSYLDEFPSAMVPVMKIMIKELEPLLWKYKVNLALWAHHHSYQRHAAIFESKVVLKSELHTLVDENGEPINVAVYQNPQATVHMVLGTGGADFNIEDAGETTDLPFPNGDPNRTWYPWSEVFFYKYGYTRVTAINATHLDIKFTDSLNNIISDRALIIGLNNEPSSGHWVLSADQSGNYVGVLLAAVNTILLCTVAIHVFHSRSESML